MDNRPFLMRFASTATGVALIALGSLVVPASGIACLYLCDESSTGNPYVDDDAALGAFVFAATIALGYGVFMAPALWKRRPFKAVIVKPPRANWYEQQFPVREEWPVVRLYGPPPEGAFGPFWPAALPVVTPPPAPLTTPEPIVSDPIIEVGPMVEVNLAELRELEEADSASPAHVPEDGTPTLMGMPAAIKFAPDDECDDDAWFT